MEMDRLHNSRLPPGPLPRHLADRFMGIVRRHAYRLARRLPAHIGVDDLIGAGCVGLADALKKFDRKSGDRFETYAECRIRGAMIDELRSNDFLSRDLRDLNKRVVATVRSLTAELGRPPEEVEIAQRLKVTVAVFREQLAKLSIGGMVSLDTSGESSEGFEVGDHGRENPEEASVRAEWRRRLSDAVEGLPERLQLLLQLYYQHDCTLREIGERLGVTESRACQLHAEAIVRLRAIRAGFAETDELALEADDAPCSEKPSGVHKTRPRAEGRVILRRAS
jgi:RNA polymerase sigma factor for flagellar operon FliA